MRNLATLLVALILVFTLSGCSGSVDVPQDSTPDAGVHLNIVCTTFPSYDWVREILGDNPGGHTVSLLLNSRADLHSYQPSVTDIAKVASADMFVYIGGESDDWVDGALQQAKNPDILTMNLLELLGDRAKAEEDIEGAQEEHEEEHEGEESGSDEHIWLSLRNAEVLCMELADALIQLDAENADYYTQNVTMYALSLQKLDGEYAAAVVGAQYTSVLFGDRFPFRYLMDDYNLSYCAAFSGCSAETEASFQTVVFLANKLDELGLPAVMVTESSDKAIAKTIIENAKSMDVKILILNAMQSETKVSDSYLGFMRQNLEVLKEAIN